jgi:acetyl esterase/lipase
LIYIDSAREEAAEQRKPDARIRRDPNNERQVKGSKMNRKLCALLMASGVLWCGSALTAETAKNQVIPLYEGTAPGSEGWTQKEGMMDVNDPHFGPAAADVLLWNVTHPTLTVFRPAAGKGNGTAIIVAPGGGFRVLAWQSEGLKVAGWLSERGYTAFILKYRLHRMPDDAADIRKDMARMMAGPPPGSSSGGTPGMQLGPEELAGISDGQRAIALVRSRASEFGISPDRVGIIGFSAGGVVSGSAGISETNRANFVGIIYSNVAGKIPANASTAFMAAAADDPLSATMPDLFQRWRAAGAEAELHIYAKGHHGFATRKQGLPVDNWMEVLTAWLDQQGFGAAAHH